MKITCNRRDDILKQKSEYEAKRAERQARYDEQSKRFYQAENDITSMVEDEIKHQLSRFKALNFYVSVDRARWGTDGLRVKVECNENEKFDDNVALAWNYNANLNKNGEVEKETSSWSGLKATTADQLESLTQTLEALKYLNSVDWATVLNKEMPKYKDYITEEDPRYDSEKPDFDRMLMQADLEDAIGNPNILISGEAGSSSSFRNGVSVYYKILRETPKQYEVTEYYKPFVDEYMKTNDDVLLNRVRSNAYTYRIAKDKFFSLIDNPVETVEVTL